MSTSQQRDTERRSQQAGQRQQQQKGDRPWGRASAIIEPTKDNQRARFVLIGAVWETENGNLKMKIEATPQQWDDPHYPRTILIAKIADDTTQRAIR